MTCSGRHIRMTVRMKATAAMIAVPRQTQRLSGTSVRRDTAMPRSSQQAPGSTAMLIFCRVGFERLFWGLRNCSGLGGRSHAPGAPYPFANPYLLPTHSTMHSLPTTLLELFVSNVVNHRPELHSRYTRPTDMQMLRARSGASRSAWLSTHPTH